MGFARVRLLILITVVTAVSTTPAATAQDFRCISPASCQALVGYAPKNASSMSDILSLFNVKNLRTILGANNLSISTPRNYTVPAGRTIKIPIPCLCTNGSGKIAGVSYRTPKYTIKEGDGLYFIASEVFSKLLQYEKIQAANKILNPNVIETGENLTIPLPCSCDDVGGGKVVHYAHVVEAGSSFDSIAERFGSDKDTLMRINGIDDEKKLMADQPIDVPLRACNFSIRSESSDSSLRVANGTYIFTANNCVRCQCDSANNWVLQCEPSQLQPSRWQTCPGIGCESSDVPSLGNTTSNNCNRVSCAYAGFNNKTILTTVDTMSTCPTSNSNNDASNIRLSWNLLFVSIYVVFLSLNHLR